MRIGLLTSYLALTEESDSGIGQHYRILADALVEQGHAVHVIHPTLEPDPARVALAALRPRWTCEIVPVQTNRWLDRLLQRSWPARVLLAQLTAARAVAPVMAAAIRQHRLQVVETHATATPAMFYLRHRHRVPVAIRISTTASQLNHASLITSRVNAWQARLEQRVTRTADALVTHTGRHRDEICALDGYAPERFTIIPHGIPDVAISGAHPPKPAGAPQEILFLGRFENRKGIDVLLQAIPAIVAAHPEVRFTLAGSRGDGVLWEQFATRHPTLAQTKVVALDRVTAAVREALYACCDLLVAPSRYESFGLVYVEAMRHAKPVIGCAVGGIPEVVTDGVTGLLVPPDDATALGTAVLRLLGDADLRARLGDAGRKDFLLRFSAAQMAEKSTRFYEALVARSGCEA